MSVHCAYCCMRWSTSTSAAIASTIGTARGTTQGSWRPRARSSVSCPARLTVRCVCVTVLVGLKAMRRTMFSPLEIPPWIPPLRFVRVRSRPFLSCRFVWRGEGRRQGLGWAVRLKGGKRWASREQPPQAGRDLSWLGQGSPPPPRGASARAMKNSSLCSVPFICVPANPEPTSNPLVAGRLIIAWARSASSLSNTGAPRPRGTLRQTHVTTPPTESPLTRT